MIEAPERVAVGIEVGFKGFLTRKSSAYAIASIETAENVARLKAEGTFSTSETVTPEIAERQGLAMAVWLKQKARLYAEAVRR